MNRVFLRMTDYNKLIVLAFDEQKKMEEDLNKKIAVLQHTLYMKENEVWKHRKQEAKLEELQTELGEEAHIDRKIKNMEANLEKLTVEHLSAQEESKALAQKVIFTAKNVAELHEQNLQVISYMNNSKEELESQVSDVRKLIIQLREEIHRKRAKWERRDEQKAISDEHYLLHGMESERVLKNTDISDVQDAVAAVRIYIASLSRLMKSKEQEIIEATMRLKEEENHVLTTQQELHDVKVKYHAAMSSSEKIAQWANGLVVSMKNDEGSVGMEIEQDMVKEPLREKEMELPKEL